MVDNKDKNASPTDNVKETKNSKDQGGDKKPSGPLGKVDDSDRSHFDDKDDNSVEHHEDDRALTWEEQEAIVGEIPPGESGFLPLDELGHIAGPAIKSENYPDEGKRYKTIFRPAQPDRNLLLTPAGAPLTNRMQPDVNVPRSPDNQVGGKDGTEAPGENT